MRQNNGEFIAAETRYEAFNTHHIPQASRSFNEKFVSDIVTMGVVDQLESVKIEEQEREFLALGRVDLSLKSVAKMQPVGKAGERVMRCHPTHALLC